MAYRLLLAASFCIPAAVSAQRTCSIRPVIDSAVGVLVYTPCATDRPARLRDVTIPLRYPEVLQAAGIPLAEDPMIAMIIDSTGTPVFLSMTVLPSTNHPGFGSTARRAAQQWRFEPALRDGHPVASFDTIQITFPALQEPYVPRGCFDCDGTLEKARERVDSVRRAMSRCVAALGIVTAWDIPDSLAWAFDVAPRCPGAEPAARAALHLAGRRYTNGIGPARWKDLPMRVRSPGLFEIALAYARAGDDFAFPIVAIQVGMRASRIPVARPGAWDRRGKHPRSGCGPMHLFASSDSVPVILLDSALVRRTLLVTDSILASETAPDSQKVFAWCLATPLR